MKTLFIATTLVFLSSISYASHPPISIEGRYDCNWVNTKTGEDIKGVMILKKSGQTYSMKSKYSDNTSYIGTGIYNKSKNHFALVFINLKNSDETGVATVDINRKVIGPIWRWTYINETTIENTTCVKRST